MYVDAKRFYFKIYVNNLITKIALQNIFYEYFPTCKLINALKLILNKK